MTPRSTAPARSASRRAPLESPSRARVPTRLMRVSAATAARPARSAMATDRRRWARGVPQVVAFPLPPGRGPARPARRPPIAGVAGGHRRRAPPGPSPGPGVIAADEVERLLGEGGERLIETPSDREGDAPALTSGDAFRGRGTDPIERDVSTAVVIAQGAERPNCGGKAMSNRRQRTRDSPRHAKSTRPPSANCRSASRRRRKTPPRACTTCTRRGDVFMATADYERLVAMTHTDAEVGDVLGTLVRLPERDANPTAAPETGRSPGVGWGSHACVRSAPIRSTCPRR